MDQSATRSARNTSVILVPAVVQSVRHSSGEKRAQALWIAAHGSLMLRAAALRNVVFSFEGPFNRVKFRRVGREVLDPSFGPFDQVAHARHLTGADVVQDERVARPQRMVFRC
jgi:hypothetical protein